MIEIDQRLVPFEGGRKCCSIEAAADFGSPSHDVAGAIDASRLIVEGSEASQAGRFFAAQGAEFRHPDDESKSRAFANTVDAGDQIQPVGEIVVLTQALEQAPDLSISACCQAFDLGFEPSFESGDGEAVAPGLEANDIFFDLLDQGHMLGQRSQPVITVADHAIVSRRCQGNDMGIDRIGLGSLAQILGIGSDLDRLEDDHLETGFAQSRHRFALIAARGLEAYSQHSRARNLRQIVTEPAPTSSIVRIPAQCGMATNDNHQFSLRHIDPDGNRDRVCSFSCPSLHVNHPVPATIRAMGGQGSRSSSAMNLPVQGANDPTIPATPRVATRGVAPSRESILTLTDSANTRCDPGLEPGEPRSIPQDKASLLQQTLRGPASPGTSG